MNSILYMTHHPDLLPHVTIVIITKHIGHCNSQEHIIHIFQRGRVTYTPYSGNPLFQTPLGQLNVFFLLRCPHFRGSFIHFSV